MHLFCGLGGYWYLRSGSCSLQHFSFRHDAFKWHYFGDCGPLDLCFYHHKAYDVSTWGYDYYTGQTASPQTNVPSTIVASGGVASAPGATVSA
jgi:hypothetical protein